MLKLKSTLTNAIHEYEFVIIFKGKLLLWTVANDGCHLKTFYCFRKDGNIDNFIISFTMRLKPQIKHSQLISVFIYKSWYFFLCQEALNRLGCFITH